ncbi:MAG: PrsW family glutamic-type intramembrane protease [Candidatus Pacebacteria bacterium]|nr:PrsW family glutamic-type intramembrane protease [Candidatus Paceibacterota bacterium]
MTEFSQILTYTLFAILPGIVWLFFFLNKDNKPEPKKIILKVFTVGMIVTIPVFLIEYSLIYLLDTLNLSSGLYNFIQYFFIVAVAEELFKYLAFRFTALKSQFLDESLDVPMYMIVSALGFATAENIILFSQKSFTFLLEPANLALVRFIGANFLHALCSGIFGFYIAISFYRTNKRFFLFWGGFLIAVIIHGVFDFFLKYSIIEHGGETELTSMVVFVLAALIISYILLGQALKKLKRLNSICKI